MKRSFSAFVFALILSCFSSLALAEDVAVSDDTVDESEASVQAADMDEDTQINAAGFVITVRGQLTATNEAGEVRNLDRRSKFYANETLKTDADSMAQLRFEDSALMTLKPESQLDIGEYHFGGDKDPENKSFLNLVSGGFRAISGAIGRQNKSAYRIETPVATIGIRGTDYELIISQDGKVFAAVHDGGISIANDAGVLNLGADSEYLFAEVGLGQSPLGLSEMPEIFQVSAGQNALIPELTGDKNSAAVFAPAVEDVNKTSMEELKALVNSGDYEEAYTQGQDMLFDFEGEREFDLLYGTAANEVGESKEAVFIFERLVEENPDDLLARLELGKAYYLTGEKEKAQFEFETVLVSEQDLPENVEANVAAYLSAIASGSEFGDPAKAEKLKAFIGIAAGHDSNANVASDAEVINAYINGFVFPTANATEAESTTYLAHQLAAAYVKPFNERTALDLKVFISERRNGSDLSYLDTGNVFFEVGNRWRFEKGLANFALRYSGVTLGDDDLYDFSQFIASWQQPASWEYADSLSVSFSTGAIRYSADTNSSRDINPTSLSFGLNKQVEKFVHAVNLSYGMDDAQGSDEFREDRDKDGVLETYIITADQYSRDYYGIGYSLNYLHDDKTTYYGVLNYQTSSYEEEDHDFFNDQGEWTKRDGDLTSISIGTRYNWNKSLQLRASATMLDVTSKISLYEYSRNTVEVGAGYQL